MLTAIILGWILNILTCLAIFHKDKQCYEFFEVTIIPYAVPGLILGYTLWEKITGL